jgi:hypothetical protein
LVDYFAEELKTLPPTLAHTPLFEKIRTSVNAIRASLSKAAAAGFRLEDVKAIRAQARELNLAIRQSSGISTFALPRAESRLRVRSQFFRSYGNAIARHI